MSRKLKVVFLSLLVLGAGMSLKTLVAFHGNGPVVAAIGGSPVPQPPPNFPW